MINFFTISQNVNEFIDVAMAILNHPLVIGSVSIGTIASVSLALLKFFIPKNKRIQLLEAEVKVLKTEKSLLIEENKRLEKRIEGAETNINVIAENSLNSQVRAILDDNKEDELVEVIVDEAQ